MAQDLIKLEVQAGNPITAGAKRIIPFSRSLRISFPGFSGGFIWNRPDSILVIDSDGQEQQLAVPDLTRIAQIAFIAFGLIMSFIIWLYFRPKG